MPLVMGLVMTWPGSGPIVPPAREVVVGGSAKQTNGEFARLMKGGSSPIGWMSEGRRPLG
jgi:hypothetical protein